MVWTQRWWILAISNFPFPGSLPKCIQGSHAGYGCFGCSHIVMPYAWDHHCTLRPSVRALLCSRMRWWAWYCGRTQYPSIFAFLVFPLWRWLTMMHGTDAMLHAITRALDARFSLSLYCSRRLYSVMSRRGSNDQWLGQSLKQAGQMLIAPSATHSCRIWTTKPPWNPSV